MSSTLLLTGASGFLGTNILPSLKSEFPKIITLGRAASNDIQADLSAGVPGLGLEPFDVVLHAAGLAHDTTGRIPESQFFNINVLGTRNLCSALEKTGLPKAFIYISSVAVYGCDEGEFIDESHPSNGDTPYARSKIAAEEFLTDWCGRHNVVLTILRPALIIGQNPPGNLGNMIRGIQKGYYFNIGSGNALKSIVKAPDVARVAIAAMDRGGIYNVCDSRGISFKQLSAEIALELGKRPPLTIPYLIAKAAALVGDLLGGRFPIDSNRLKKLTSTLTYSNRKALEIK